MTKALKGLAQNHLSNPILEPVPSWTVDSDWGGVYVYWGGANWGGATHTHRTLAYIGYCPRRCDSSCSCRQCRPVDKGRRKRTRCRYDGLHPLRAGLRCAQSCCWPYLPPHRLGASHSPMKPMPAARARASPLCLSVHCCAQVLNGLTGCRRLLVGTFSFYGLSIPVCAAALVPALPAVPAILSLPLRLCMLAILTPCHLCSLASLVNCGPHSRSRACFYRRSAPG